MPPHASRRPDHSPTHHRLMRLAATTILAGLLSTGTACTPQAPTTTWDIPTVYLTPPPPLTATPTPIVTPTPTATPTPTYDQALYDQAVAVYDMYYRWHVAIESQGGIAQLPPELNTILVGDALSSVAEISRLMAQNGFHWSNPPTFHLAVVEPYAGSGPPADAVFALHACEEISGAFLLDGKGQQLTSTETTAWNSYAYFQIAGNNNLVISKLDSMEVDSCDA